MKLKTILLLVILLLNGCASMQSIDPYTGERKVNNTTKGAVAGTAGLAGLGAIIGALAGGGEGAAIGASIGGGVGLLAGGGVGYYMDRQEDDLRTKLVNTGVSIQRRGNSLNLVMPGHVTFDTDSANIKSSFYSTLESVIVVLNEYDNTKIVVTGHTDSTGGFAHNKLLSHDRAQSVSLYLSKNGLNRGRIYTEGMSDQYPIASNNTKDGRALNRRAEVTIVPNK